MPEKRLTTAVNEHYLNKVMDLSDEMAVEATEDIYDARGTKLLAKGAKVSRALQEKLIVHKLRKPLESSILVEGGVDANLVHKVATRLLAENAALADIYGACGGSGPAPLTVLSGLKLGNAMNMMLTISQRSGGQALDHAVIVSLLSICMARTLRMSDQDQASAGLAGLLHDIGELYIDPAYVQRGRRLLPHEWAHIKVHPHTGQMLIAELEAWPAAVGRAVAEHHERFDGSGYPRQLKGAQLSTLGQVLAIAETVADTLDQDHPLHRAEMGLKIIPGEYGREAVSAIMGALKAPPPSTRAGWKPGNGAAETARLHRRLLAVMQLCEDTLNGAVTHSPKSREALTGASNRIQTIYRAFVGTGLATTLGELGKLGELGEAEAALSFERDAATGEIQWRLRDTARELALSHIGPGERQFFTPLIRQLDDDAGPTAAAPLLARAPSAALPGQDLPRASAQRVAA